MVQKVNNYLDRVYSNRFDEQQRQSKLRLWQVLIEQFLQGQVGVDRKVLDIGGGYGEFINQVHAREKHLIDLNPDAKTFTAPDVKVWNVNLLSQSAKELNLKDFDIIFASNFFEHLLDQEQLFIVLELCFNYLKPGGSLLVIQPNFKYCAQEYYDFIDHYLPITHLSLQEALLAIGFKIDQLIPKFLPYSTKGRPTSTELLKIYLKLPFLWQIFGAQMFVKATKPFATVI